MKRLARVVVVFVLMFASCGSPAPDRIFHVDLAGNRFEPEKVTLKAGEKVRFVLKNRDAVDHEFVIGDESVQDQHASGRSGEMHHGASNAIAVARGKTATLDFTAPPRATTLLIGCHVEDHYQSGMRATADVTE